MFRWTPNKEQACILLAEDALSIPQIAKQIHVNECTIDRWKKVAEFKERIAANTKLFLERCLQSGLARKENRLAALTDLHQRQMQIVAERGASKEMQKIPGGSTGLVAMTWNILDLGPDPNKYKGGKPAKAASKQLIKKYGKRLIQEYEADTGLSREIRGTLEHVARELGQWEEKTQVKVSGELSIAEVLRDRRHRREAAEASAAVSPQPPIITPEIAPPATTQ